MGSFSIALFQKDIILVEQKLLKWSIHVALMIVTDFQFLKSFRCAFENISSMVFFFLVHGIVDDKTGTCIKSFKSFIVDSVLISRKNVKIIKFKNFTFSRPLNLNEYPIYP